MNEIELIQDADRRAGTYLAGAAERRVFPDADTLQALAGFDETWPEQGRDAAETLALLDRIGSPATTASNGPHYYGFVLGATLPAAGAAERLALAWDQCASSFDTSPVADRIERVAGRWVLEALDLPRESVVAFGTSATACALACLTTARRQLLAQAGWNIDEDGLDGAPALRVLVPETIHVSLRKVLRIMGFGRRSIIECAVDAQGRLDPERLPTLDARTLLCLQAGEVNTGEFDRFADIIPRARTAGSWVHVDGAFGLWARATRSHRALTDGIEQADSWTTDGHKWLNTPYDGAMAICRHREAMARAMNAAAAYIPQAADAQMHLVLEFSRRARGIPIWAALRSLGRDGVAALVERHCRQARRLAEGLAAAGIEVVNRVPLNQVLIRAGSDEATLALRERALAGGRIWFGPSRWQNRVVLRLSVSSWRTTDADIDRAIAEVTGAFRSLGESGNAT